MCHCRRRDYYLVVDFDDFLVYTRRSTFLMGNSRKTFSSGHLDKFMNSTRGHHFDCCCCYSEGGNKSPTTPVGITCRIMRLVEGLTTMTEGPSREILPLVKRSSRVIPHNCQRTL